MHSPMFSYQIIQTKLLVEDISQIFLLPAPLANAAERSFIYEAGQYVNIHYEEGYAPLSIASAPRKDQQLEFHLSHPVRNAKAQKLWQLALQAQCWQLSEAIGDCRVDRLNRNQPIIFLAYETGFAPIKAVIEALVQSLPLPPLFLYWMGASSTQFYLTSLLEKWTTQFNFTYFPLVVPERNFSTEHLFSAILQHHQGFSHYQVYASGPRTLMQAAYKFFIENGLQQNDFYSDLAP